VKIFRLDDYQSWLISRDNLKIVIDPWFINEFNIPHLPWLLSRRHHSPLPLSIEDISDLDILLISSKYSDHLNKNTLSKLPKDIKVICSNSSYKLLKKLGFININILIPSQKIITHGLSISGVKSGFPYSSSSIGFFIEDLTSEKNIFLETHVVSNKALLLLNEKKIDAFIGTSESVKLLNIELSMSPQRVFKIIKQLRPTYFIPTGINVHHNEGFLNNFLNVSGNYNDLHNLLYLNNIHTQIVCREPGSEIRL